MSLAFQTLNEEVTREIHAQRVNSWANSELNWTAGWVNNWVNSWVNLWIYRRVCQWVNCRAIGWVNKCLSFVFQMLNEVKTEIPA